MKKWIKIALWSFFAGAVIVLMVSVANYQKTRTLSAPEIRLKTDVEHPFISPEELLKRIKNKGLWREGMQKEALDVAEIEALITSYSQVKSAKVYTNIGDTWEIEVELRTPIARIFNKFDESFYLDEEGEIVHTTPSHTARVIVFTGNINDRISSLSVGDIINNDSLKSIQKLDEIYRISNYVCHDPLLHSLIGQVHLEKNGDFVLIPLVGDVKIVLGTADSDEEVKKKFKKLRIFYKEAMPNVGWDKYSEISLKFEGQIVCKTKPV